jgi:DNA-binding CsgD family transcriptional regulator
MESLATDLDLIHTSPIIARSVADELVAQAPELRLGTVDYSWVRFAGSAFPAPLVVLDAFLDDHVPLALKVRALRMHQSRVIVMGLDPGSVLGRRALAEGADLVVPPTLALAETAAAIIQCWRTPTSGPATFPPFAPDLTQREIQVLCLYAARRAPSIQQLSRALGVGPETVRTHLRTGRAKYAALGRSVGNRTSLAAELAADGILIPADTWAAQHRW